MGRRPQRAVIPAPDITKLAKGIYAPQLQKLEADLASARGDLKARQKKIAELEKALRGVTNDRDAKLQDLANSKESNRQLRLENANLRRKLRELTGENSGT